MARIPSGPARPPLRWFFGVALLALLVVGGGGALPTAQAATITVTTFEDENGSGAACSLREAIIAANDDAPFGGCSAGSGADTIVLGAGTYHVSISPFINGARAGAVAGAGIIGNGGGDPEFGDLDILTAITINGAGPAATIIDGAWPNEFETDRIFHVADGSLTLNGVTVRDGEPAFDEFLVIEPRQEALQRARREARREAALQEEQGGGFRTQQPECENGFFNPEDGGGIRVEAGATLNASNVLVDHNATFEGVGGGLFVSCEATAVLTDVTFTRNLANVGGGIHNDGYLTFNRGSIGSLDARGDGWPDRNTAFGNGGGLWNSGEATLSQIGVFGNLALFNDGGGVGNDGTLTMERSTVHRNYSGSIFDTGGDGGGIANLDGAVFTLNLTNVTISENATEGDGGGLLNFGEANLNNVTIAFNRADDDNDGDGDGGGIFEPSPDTVNLRNTIVAGNVDGSLPGDTNHPDCSGPMASQGNNLVQNPAGCTGLVGSDRTGVDPLLLPLADNGGNTLTHALRAGSPAIDAGAGWAPTDQRGAPRPFRAAGDIGAYEYWLCMGGVVNVVGTDAGEVLDVRGPPAADVVIALGGNDVVIAGPGKDRVCGGAGKDRILLGGGRDKANGQGGDDIVRGGGNPDVLKGGSGDDLLVGGGTLRDNGDRCNGGRGTDEARGCEQEKSIP